MGLSVLGSRVAALRLSVLAVAGEIAEADGARDVSGWLAATTRQDPAPTHHGEKLAAPWTPGGAGSVRGWPRGA